MATTVVGVPCSVRNRASSRVGSVYDWIVLGDRFVARSDRSKLAKLTWMSPTGSMGTDTDRIGETPGTADLALAVIGSTGGGDAPPVDSGLILSS